MNSSMNINVVAKLFKVFDKEINNEITINMFNDITNDLVTACNAYLISSIPTDISEDIQMPLWVNEISFNHAIDVYEISLSSFFKRVLESTPDSGLTVSPIVLLYVNDFIELLTEFGDYTAANAINCLNNAKKYWNAIAKFCDAENSILKSLDGFSFRQNYIDTANSIILKISEYCGIENLLYYDLDNILLFKNNTEEQDELVYKISSEIFPVKITEKKVLLPSAQIKYIDLDKDLKVIRINYY